VRSLDPYVVEEYAFQEEADEDERCVALKRR
jgi:hypothetical protein